MNINIFENMSIEEMNEMLKDMPNDFDTEKKIQKRIINKTMNRIKGPEHKVRARYALHSVAAVAAVCVLVLCAMWAIGFDTVSGYVKKVFFTPGVNSSIIDDGSDIWVETTPDEVIVHKKDEYTPLILAEPATGFNENGKLSIVNITSTNMAVIEKSPQEYENIEQYYIDQNGKYYSGLMLELQLELEDKVIAELKKLYADDLHISGNTFIHDSNGAKDTATFEGYNFSITANGNEYSEVGRNTEVKHAYGGSCRVLETDDYHIGFDGWTFIIDANDINTNTVYTLNMDHKIFGKISVDFTLKEATELGNDAGHEVMSVMHNGITITAVKYKTEIDGKKLIAVDTAIDDSAFPVETTGGGVHIASYYDKDSNDELWVCFKKGDGTIVAPYDWNNNTFYFDADLIDEGDDFIIPGVGISDNNAFAEKPAALPIPDDGKTIKKDIVYRFGLGDLIIDKVEISEDFSSADNVIEGKGLLMKMKFKFAEELEDMVLVNIRAHRPYGELPEGQNSYHAISGVDSWVSTSYLYDENEPYFIKIQDNDKESIPLDIISVSSYMLKEFRFDF